MPLFAAIVISLTSICANANTYTDRYEQRRLHPPNVQENPIIQAYRSQNADFRARVRRFGKQHGGLKAVEYYGYLVECRSVCREYGNSRGMYSLSREQIEGPSQYKIERADLDLANGWACSITWETTPDFSRVELFANCLDAQLKSYRYPLGGEQKLHMSLP